MNSYTTKVLESYPLYALDVSEYPNNISLLYLESNFQGMSLVIKMKQISKKVKIRYVTYVRFHPFHNS